MPLSRILQIGFFLLFAFSLMSFQPHAFAAESIKETSPTLLPPAQEQAAIPSWFDLSLLEVHLLNNINLMHQPQFQIGRKENILEYAKPKQGQWIRHMQRQDATSPIPSQTQDIPSAQ